MRALAIVVFVALAVAAAPRSAKACKCSGPIPPVDKAFAGSALVVEARVLSHEFAVYSGFHTRLAITKTHKGESRTEVEIVASRTCAYNFEKGKRYLVYATSDGGSGYSTTYCTRTAPLADAKDDIVVITGAPPPPAEPPVVRLTAPLLEWTSNPTVQWMRVVAMMLAAT